jgi:hypothetical protein
VARSAEPIKKTLNPILDENELEVGATLLGEIEKPLAY